MEKVLKIRMVLLATREIRARVYSLRGICGSPSTSIRLCLVIPFMTIDNYSQAYTYLFFLISILLYTVCLLRDEW